LLDWLIEESCCDQVVIASGWEYEDRSFDPWHFQATFDPRLPKKRSKYSSDGSGSKIFDLGRVNFLLLRSDILGLGLSLENFPKKCQILQLFCPLDQKQSHWVGSKSTRVKDDWPLIYCGSKNARVGSETISKIFTAKKILARHSLKDF